MNITPEKLKDFESYHGDGEMWSRSKRSDSIISNDEWNWIDCKIGQFHMITKGLAAPRFEKEVRDELERVVPSVAVQERMWELGKSNFGIR